MNVAHPDDMDEEIADDESTQDSDNPDQQAANAPSEAAPHRERTATNPVIINK